MDPGLRSARTKDMPNVFRPGKFVGLTGTVANPVLVKFPAVFKPEKMKSSVVTSAEFLQGRLVEVMVMVMRDVIGFGIQKSWIGSGSEANVMQTLKQRRIRRAITRNRVFASILLES